jgi:hypothetical protein
VEEKVKLREHKEEETEREMTYTIGFNSAVLLFQDLLNRITSEDKGE